MAHVANTPPGGLVPNRANLQSITYGAFSGTITVKEMGGVMNLHPTVEPRQDIGTAAPTGPQWWPLTG